jgi:hypothetical protein
MTEWLPKKYLPFFISVPKIRLKILGTQENNRFLKLKKH